MLLDADELAVLGVGLGIKLLLWPAYHSTDFEVHRNWLAITHTQALDKWYVESRSEWTLDYPPLFAWFEWALSLVAARWDERIVDIDNHGYVAESCVGFQRLSVAISELVLFAALRRFVRVSGGSLQSKMVAALAFLSPGLVFVDHIHFQYNGFLFGILVYSLVFALEHRNLQAGTTFAVLLCFKHIYMYIAPAYFLYLLFDYCVVRRTKGQRKSIVDFGASALQLAKLGSAVAIVFGLVFGPFVAMGQTQQLVERLFPFKRGLCHAYWAPNFWALYAFADRVLIALATRFSPALLSVPTGVDTTTRGLVGDTNFALLPDISPLTTFVVTLAAQAPAYAVLLPSRARSPLRFVESVVLCAFASFIFGWHVHEKAIMLILVPLSLLMASPRRLTLRMFAVLSVAGYYSLFPLLFGAQELPVKAVVLALWTLLCLALLRADDGVSAWCCLSAIERLYIIGHFVLFCVTELVPGALFRRLQFLPLVLVSVYTATGVTYSWLGLVADFLSH
ncbi:glycosyl transferase [Coemansia sp. RSA 1813]|nr:glycosyl transferase [Coemansia sp. RSA 1646]KAJ1772097.1 glycosyl transferase [Coemansia sp. RSA 1843]KAJ2090434.1 glycosyl transferase [Coemansia sp. RSA 986]KAJ2215401.1 glycosyl transferase [Coemansia sp. RSA 487]KAJ2569990.1 glycosyl transferase [Coemansia sp. RSA 1813]